MYVRVAATQRIASTLAPVDASEANSGLCQAARRARPAGHIRLLTARVRADGLRRRERGASILGRGRACVNSYC